MWCVLSKRYSARADAWKGDAKALKERTAGTMNAIVLVY